MLQECLPKKVFHGEFQEGDRSQGGQKKLYKDTLKASLNEFNSPTESCDHAAPDRAQWCDLIRKGAA